MLAYLASGPLRAHRRDTLTAIFWPELDQPRARAALRQMLHAMRRALGSDVITNVADDAIALDSSQIWCDAPAFVAAATAGDPHVALELYRGDFLEGFYLNGAPEFEQWADAERTRLRRLASSAAARGVEARFRSGEIAEALAFARRRVALAADDEDAHRDLVRLLDVAGDRAGALRAYHELERRLADEFGCEPAPETQALAATVRERLAVHAIAATQSPIPPRTPMPAPVPRRSRVRAATVVGIVLAVGAGGIALNRSSDARLSPRRVVVATFDNRTSDTSIDRLGDMAAEWVRQGLATTGLVQVADGPLLSPTSDERAHSVEELARKAAAGIVVGGTFYEANDSLRFEATITDARQQRIVANVSGVSGPREHPERVVETLRQRITAALATVMDSSLATWAAAASQPPTYEAYQDFAAGMQAYNLLDPQTATFYFRRAAMRDTSYSLPLVFMATSAMGLNHCATADSIAAVLAPRRPALPPLDRDQLEIAVQRCHGNLQGTYLAARRMATELPASDFALATLGHYAVLAGRPREALAALRHVDPSRGSAQYWAPYFLWVTRALHQLGDHDEELQQALVGRRRYPDQLGSLREEAVALASLGRVREVNAVLDSLGALKPNPFRRADLVMQEAGAELQAHGRLMDGRRVAERALGWYAALPADEREAASMQFELAHTLYLAGRPREALPILQSLVTASPDSERFLGLAGTVEAMLGDSAGARAMDQRLRTINRPYVHGLGSYWRACLAAALGENDAAVSLLRDALANGAVFPVPPIWMHADPCFTRLHGSPGFSALERPNG